MKNWLIVLSLLMFYSVAIAMDYFPSSYVKGVEAYGRGDYKKGIAYIKKAFHKMSHNRSTSNTNLWLICYNVGYGYYSIGEYSLASDYVKKADNYWRQKQQLPKESSEFEMDHLLLQYNIMKDWGKAAQADSLLDLIRQYHPATADRDHFESLPCIFFPLLQVYCGIGDYQAAKEYIQCAAEDSSQDDLQDQRLFENVSDIGKAYLQCSTAGDSAAFYIDRVQEDFTAFFISFYFFYYSYPFMDNICEFIKLLSYHRSNEIDEERKILKEIYEINSCKKISKINFDWYRSPLSKKDWLEILEIEKELQ